MAEEKPCEASSVELQGGSSLDAGAGNSSNTDTGPHAKHVFTPPPHAGAIIGMAVFRDTILLSCQYALYQIVPTSDGLEWIVEQVRAGEPSCVRY